MASNPPFELEDQTDADFFDKLVNDDVDDNVVFGSGGLNSVGLTKGHDVPKGDEFDEGKAFANLSISESGDSNHVSETIQGIEGGGNVGDVHTFVDGDGSGEGKQFSDLGVSEGRNVNDVSEVMQVVEPNDNVREESVETKERMSGGGEALDLLESSNSLSFDDGNVQGGGVMTSESRPGLMNEGSGSVAGDVKEIQWTSFSDSSGLDGVGSGSYSDFFRELGEGGVNSLQNEATTTSGNEAVENAATGSSYTHTENVSENGAVAGQSANEAHINSVQYWENLYPGWKYDPNTGHWYQLPGYDADAQETVASAHGNVQESFDVGGNSQWAVSDVQASQVSYAQAQSAVQTVSQCSSTDNMPSWNHVSQQNGEYQYPSHMLFDANYPGWFYDTIAQEWRSLESYHSSTDSMNLTHNQQSQNGFISTSHYSHNVQATDNRALQGLGSGNLNQNWATSSVDYIEQGSSVHQSELPPERPAVSSSVGQSWQAPNDSNFYSNGDVDHHKLAGSREMSTAYDASNQNLDSSKWVFGPQSFVPTYGTSYQSSLTPHEEQHGTVQYSNAYYDSQNGASVSQPLFSNAFHVAHSPNEGRSSAGRPPHALVTFGFGGKLVVMKDSSSRGFSPFVGKDPDGHFISVLNLMEVASTDNGSSGEGPSACCYFRSLIHQSFPGPLVGGNAGSKDLNKWIDERIGNCESVYMDYGKGEAPKLLLSLLKIAYQHYGKLRSSSVDTGLMENDLPESTVAKLFATAKRNGQFNEHSAIAKCFINLQSEAQIQTTATDVQNLLISGRKEEALQRAQDGQFWGFALILARELGDQFYANTVKQMAVTQLVRGSPLRTLCLLIARKPEEVIATKVMDSGVIPGAVHGFPQEQDTGYSVLDNWEENLAAITANRTEDDHKLITHLGDCLWREKNDVTAAHICYLVAEANFELYSERARLCLVGADHLSFPRTYASPEAIQRTEFFEYSKVLGNSQFVLLPLQPYKLIYAHMLAEVGKISESLKYCQAALKSLKAGRSPEAETLKQLLSSLEDRIRTHQQSGYAANLAPTRIVGKLLTFIDSTAHRVVGGLPPPVPAAAQGNAHGSELHFQTSGPNLPSIQSNVGMSSLMPSASMEPISQWTVDGSRMTEQNRSISEPDIGRIPKPDKVNSETEASTSPSVGKQSGSTARSRFGRFNFGAHILQRTVDMLKPRPGHQAKLGDTNKFYYDEKLKRWVEEGAEPPAEETTLPPPPTASFQNGTSDYNLKDVLNGGLHAADHCPESKTSIPFGSSSGNAAIPPSSNQFSARGRMGVRSRYVDTFNKGNNASGNLFHTPSGPSAKPASVAGAKFFIPTAPSSNEQTLGMEAANQDEGPTSRENSTMSTSDSLQNLAPFPAGMMQRFPSVDDIPNRDMGIGNSSLASQSRRTASWNEIHQGRYTAPLTTEMKPSPLASIPRDSSSASLNMNGGKLGDDLQDVEL